MTVVEEDLDRLLTLSDVDAQRARIDAKLDDLPEQQAVDEAEERRDAAVQRGGELRAEVTTVEAQQRKLERDIDQFRIRLAKEQERLYGGEVTNAKEMQSVEAEIESTQGRVDEREDELLDTMQTAEDLGEQIDAAARSAEQTSAEITELEAERDRAAQQLLAERAELDVEAEQLRDDIAATPLQHYDEVRERVPVGVAVGTLEGMSCSACRIDLPHAEVNELRGGDPLTTCPNCHRLLVVR